jgi:hypothetical protein
MLVDRFDSSRCEFWYRYHPKWLAGLRVTTTYELGLGEQTPLRRIEDYLIKVCAGHPGGSPLLIKVCACVFVGVCQILSMLGSSMLHGAG